MKERTAEEVFACLTAEIQEFITDEIQKHLKAKKKSVIEPGRKDLHEIIEPGMLIHAAHEGMHLVLTVTPFQDHQSDPAWAHIEPDARFTPSQVQYETAFETNGQPVKTKRVYSCDIGFCRPVTPAGIQDIILYYQSIISALRSIPLPPTNVSSRVVNWDMASRAARRPADFASLTPQKQWEIDKSLGILDWDNSGGKPAA